MSTGRQFAMLYLNIWTPGGEFGKLTGGAQRLYLYLFSQPDIAATGVIAYRPGRWAASARGLVRAEVAEYVQELADARYVLLDEDTDELLVRTYMRWAKVFTNPNLFRTIPALANEVASTAIRQAINVELSRGRKLLESGQRPDGLDGVDETAAMLPLDGIPEPPPEPPPGGVKKGAAGGVADGVPEGLRNLLAEPVPEGVSKGIFHPVLSIIYSLLSSSGSNRTTAEAARARDRRARALAAGFCRFWQEYPRKKARPDAIAAYVKAVEGDPRKGRAATDPVLVLAGVRGYAMAVRGKDAEFVAYPATWLNRRSWEDDEDGPGEDGGGQATTGYVPL